MAAALADRDTDAIAKVVGRHLNATCDELRLLLALRVELAGVVLTAGLGGACRRSGLAAAPLRLALLQERVHLLACVRQRLVAAITSTA